MNCLVGRRAADRTVSGADGELVTFLHETARHFISLTPFIFSSICSFFTSTSKYFSCSWYSSCTHSKWMRCEGAFNKRDLKSKKTEGFSVRVQPAAGRCGETWRLGSFGTPPTGPGVAPLASSSATAPLPRCRMSLLRRTTGWRQNRVVNIQSLTMRISKLVKAKLFFQLKWI